MNNYTIYCTVEQVKKAFELGAPIEILPNYTEFRGLPLVKCKDGNDRPCIIPTAEQMIGWLEEQHIIERVDIFCFMSWGYMIIRDDLVHPYVCVAKNENEGFSSRKEATLAAIDAALEYLTSKK